MPLSTNPPPPPQPIQLHLSTHIIQTRRIQKCTKRNI